VQDANTTNTLRTTEDYGLILHFFQCHIGHAEYTLYWTMRSGRGSNFPNFSNQEYDVTVDKWKNTIDPAERATLLAKLYQIEQEYLPEIPVFNEVKVMGATAKLQGIELSQIGAHQFQNATVSK
jgi:peptide/nickel transport system substrate-binding protein